MDEFKLIEALKRKIPKAASTLLGIGDDAAVLNVAKGKQLVVSTDVMVEGVDFKIKELPPEKIGRKALAINLSDMAAMGAKPKAFVIAIGKPLSVTPGWLMRFYDGLLKLAKQFNVDCVGGDFSKAKEFFAAVTIFGEAAPDSAIQRSGARVGDWIAVTGSLGGSILRHHHDFTSRVREGLYLAEHFTPTAMIDISDGLAQDLGHILKASNVGARIDLDRVPMSCDAKRLASGNPEKALQRALGDGEDFELLFTMPPWQKIMLDKSWKKKFPKVPLSWIGKIEGKKQEVFWCKNGKPVRGFKIRKKGFSHF